MLDHRLSKWKEDILTTKFDSLLSILFRYKKKKISVFFF